MNVKHSHTSSELVIDVSSF